MNFHDGTNNRQPAHGRVSDAGERFGQDRMCRDDNTPVHLTCATCNVGTPISFISMDRVAAALQAGLDGVDFADAPGKHFDALRPLQPGERGLDGACINCGARFRIIATGGELSRDGALEYVLKDVVDFVPNTNAPVGGSVHSPRPSPVARAIVGLIALALFAGALMFIPAARRAEQQRSLLLERGKQVDAKITSETLRRRSTASLDIVFPAANGATIEQTVDVPLRSGWRAGDQQVNVTYDPQRPQTVVISSGGLRHAWLQYIYMGLLTLLSAWLTRALWRSRRKPAAG